MTTPAALEAPAGRRAAIDLAAIRDMWGDLLAAIDEKPHSEWPPRECREWEQPQPEQGPVIGRLPLTLREHPAPLNLDALSAAVEVERALFTTADHIAHQTQRPVRHSPVALRSIPPRTVMRPDPDDMLDPARWHPATTAGPGSRRHGLHWCAVWLEGRALGEDTTAPRPSNTVHVPMFTPLDAATLDQLADVAHRARRTVEQALARAGRRTTLDDPCPWCGAHSLVVHTSGDAETAYATCGTGEPCPAPVILSAGHRLWQGRDLPGLWQALDTARRKTEGSDA
jgi:hypothetical protein